MEMIIDTANSAPLFAQLIGQIKKAVVTGRIHPGDALPSVQQLANDLMLNIKTVAKAYHLLELDRIIQIRVHRGTSVHPDARVNCARIGWSWFPSE
jgi:GntR family transcriptional regulator